MGLWVGAAAPEAARAAGGWLAQVRLCMWDMVARAFAECKGVGSL